MTKGRMEEILRVVMMINRGRERERTRETARLLAYQCHDQARTNKKTRQDRSIYMCKSTGICARHGWEGRRGDNSVITINDDENAHHQRITTARGALGAIMAQRRAARELPWRQLWLWLLPFASWLPLACEREKRDCCVVHTVVSHSTVVYSMYST